MLEQGCPAEQVLVSKNSKSQTYKNDKNNLLIYSRWYIFYLFVHLKNTMANKLSGPAE